MDQKSIEQICGFYEEIDKSKGPLSSTEIKLLNTLVAIAKDDLKDDKVIQQINIQSRMGMVPRNDARAALRMIKESLGLKRIAP